MNWMFWIPAAFTILMAGTVLYSMAMTAKPVGSQNQAMFITILTVSAVASIVGWWIGYLLFKGNPTAQLQFLLFFTFLLFMATMTSATASAFQLYGLRETLATSGTA